jgi:hypothetical protein
MPGMDNDKADKLVSQKVTGCPKEDRAGAGSSGCLELSKAALRSVHRNATSEKLIGGVR